MRYTRRARTNILTAISSTKAFTALSVLLLSSGIEAMLKLLLSRRLAVLPCRAKGEVAYRELLARIHVVLYM